MIIGNSFVFDVFSEIFNLTNNLKIAKGLARQKPAQLN